MPLCTQADVEKLLQITFGNQPDDSVTQYIAQASALVVGYCGQELAYATGIEETFEETHRISNHRLGRFPIVAVASVVENGVTLTADDDYVFYRGGRLRRLSGGTLDWYWSTYPNGVIVTYSAGYGGAAPAPYDEIPDDVVLATAQLAADLFRQGAAFAAHGVNPVKSVALDGSDTITYDTSAVKAGPVRVEGMVEAMLAPYRRRRM